MSPCFNVQRATQTCPRANPVADPVYDSKIPYLSVNVHRTKQHGNGPERFLP
jgi:hypothetical protein